MLFQHWGKGLAEAIIILVYGKRYSGLFAFLTTNHKPLGQHYTHNAVTVPVQKSAGETCFGQTFAHGKERLGIKNGQIPA